MARIKVAATLLITLLACAGCSAFFDFNAFASLDTPSKPVLADYQGVNGLSNLSADLSSPAVVAQLSADPALVAEIKAYLESKYLSGPLTSPDQQTAAALYSDLSLATTSGDTLVNNVVTTIMSTASTGKTITAIITSIIPASVLADKTGAAFTAMIQGLLDANDAYILLGNSIPTYGPPPGANLGDIAQKAAVACMMRAVVDAVIQVAVPKTQAEAVAEMFQLVTNDPTTPAPVSTLKLTTDPFNPMPSALLNIFNAAGAPLPV
jgi:hypothetical protein